MTLPIQVRTEPPKPEDIKAQYGFVALIAEQIPEIGNIMQQAVREQWTAERFSLALAGTGWWKSNSDQSRQWLVKNIADPASANNEMTTGAEHVRNVAAAMGFVLPEHGQATQIWLEGRMRGLDDTATQALIASRLVDLTPTQGASLGGRYGQVVNEMYKQALDYGYSSPTLHKEIVDHAKFIVTSGGVRNTEGWRTKMMETAAAKYAPFAQRLRGGETLMDVARPYLDAYAETLEIPPQAISMADKALQKALQGQPDGKGGVAAPPVWQLVTELRKDARYGYTNNARQEAAKTLQTIGRSFGMVG